MPDAYVETTASALSPLTHTSTPAAQPENPLNPRNLKP